MREREETFPAASQIHYIFIYQKEGLQKVIQTVRESVPIYYGKPHLLNSLYICIAQACNKIQALFVSY